MNRYDRTGESVDLDTDPWHDPRCRDGWLGENEHGQLIPCLTCRKHLRHRPPAINRLKPETDDQ